MLSKSLKVFVGTVFILSLLLVFSLGTRKGERKRSYGVLVLKKAWADGETAFPEDEAGICAYLKIPSLNVSDVQGAFLAGFQRGNNYAIGQVQVSNNGGATKPFVYVDDNGWIAAYYKRDDHPSAEMVYWNQSWLGDPDSMQNVNFLNSTLVKAICRVVEEAGGNCDDYTNSIGFYNFEYTGANRMMIISKASPSGSSSDRFEVTVPQGYTFYEVSYSLSGSISFYMDNTLVRSCGSSASRSVGEIQSNSLTPDCGHVFSFHKLYSHYRGAAALVLVYQVPEG